MYALLLLFAVCCCASALEATKPHYDFDKAEEYFNNFITEHNKIYKTEAEKNYRFKIFKNNLEKVNTLNKDDHHAVYGITPFMDVTTEEVIKRRTGLEIDNSDDFEKLKDDDVKYDPSVPEAFDWRDKGVVTRVKDQGDCRSCWAFSAIGQIESSYAIKHRKIMEFSEQQLIDCISLANGCCGGSLLKTFRTLIKKNGVMQSKDYPYQQNKFHCRSAADQFVANVTDVKIYKFNTQEKVKQILYQRGPLSVGIKASSLHTYHYGIVSDDHCSQDPVNHAVLLVGYGSENNVPYWIVKNSWGEKFGEGGYFRIPRGENAHSCGMMTTPMFAAVIQ